MHHPNLAEMSVEGVTGCLEIVEVFSACPVASQRCSGWLPDIDLDITYLTESCFLV